MRSALFPTVIGISLMTLAATAVGQPRPRPAAPPSADASKSLTADALVTRQGELHSLLSRQKPATARQLEAAARAYMTRIERAPAPVVAGRASVKPKSPIEHARDVAAPLRGDLGTDIEALATLVMVEAARAADADLKSLLTKLNQSRRTKEDIRRYLDYRKRLRAGEKASLPAGLASMSTLSAEQALEMADAMHRRNQALALLSHLLKMVSATQATIIGNLKP
jgi:hypothetical protein